MNQSVNQETRIIRYLDLHSYFGYGVKIIEIPHSGLGEYLENMPRPDKPPLEGVLEKLTKELLDHERMRERFMKHRISEHNESGMCIPVFKREQIGGDVVCESKAFGLTVHGYGLGSKNYAFDVHSIGDLSGSEKVHETACKILEEQSNGYWSRRLSEIRLQVTVAPTGRQNVLKETAYGYNPEKIARQEVAYVPFDKFSYVKPEKVLDSFTSADNEGVQMCTVHGFPVYFRFVYEEREPTFDRQLTLRRACALGEKDGEVLLRDHQIKAEFFVKSVANNLHADGPDVDYVREQRLMEEVATALYVGMWQKAFQNRNMLRA